MKIQQFDIGTLVIVAVLVFSGLRRLFEASWAWRKLVKHYRYNKHFVGRSVPSLGFYVGTVNLGPLISSKISPRGLYLSAMGPLSLLWPSLLVPWHELRIIKYMRAPLFRGYLAALTPASGERLEIQLADNVVRAARSYLQIPAEEQPQ